MAQNTQIAYLTIIPEGYIVYLVIFPICTSPGDVLYTPEGEYSNYLSNRGIPVKSLVFFWLKWTVNGSGHSCMYKLSQYQLSALLYTCMSSNYYFSLLFTELPPLMMSWEHPYDVIRGGSSLSDISKYHIFTISHYIVTNQKLSTCGTPSTYTKLYCNNIQNKRECQSQ